MTLIEGQSFKSKLQQVAKEKNITSSEAWQNLILERFLVRLSKSPYQSQFVLKGGILLAKHVPIGRETKDLDFSVFEVAQDAATLTRIFEEIALIDLNDGFIFKNVKLELLSPYHMQYPGAQIHLEACFETSRVSVFIDLGFFDQVEVKTQEIPLSSIKLKALFESSVALKCYPLEFVFAEKLQTVFFRGELNSRMKDYHDLYSMIMAGVLQKNETFAAIDSVFNHRKTIFKIPLQFDPAGLKELQKNWQRYKPSVYSPKNLPSSIEEVIATINNWLL